jgi:hypothetical protein
MCIPHRDDATRPAAWGPDEDDQAIVQQAFTDEPELAVIFRSSGKVAYLPENTFLASAKSRPRSFRVVSRLSRLKVILMLFKCSYD